MAIHITDLLNLELNSSTTHEEFLRGNFVTQKKTKRKFSGMAHDQVHEQLNAMVEGDGRVIGITENDEALRRWSVAGPEVARLLSEVADKENTDTANHEQIPSIQNSFGSDVKKLLEKFEEAGNPFSDTSKDLYALDSKIVMSSSVKHSIEIAEQTGKTQLETFVSQRLSHSATIPFFNPIAKNNFPLFSSSSEKVSDKTRTRISNLNSDNLFFTIVHSK